MSKVSNLDESPHDDGPSLECFLLGEIDFQDCLALSQRLVYEISGRSDGQIAVLLCEHPGTITVGRLGSRAHIRLAPEELAALEWETHFVNRGGGCVLHVPGQLAVYPIVPLQWHGWSVGHYLDRLQNGLLATLREFGIAGQTRPDAHGIWSRGGQLAACGVAVKQWTTYFGAYLNVDPVLRQFRQIDGDPWSHAPAASLASERRQPIKMAAVRATIIGHLAHAFDCQRYHLYTGHPLASGLSRRATIQRR